tara:strand:- start:471 stop:3248 length:2778 start_codon:yes stop_codon:yes gene_type:complete
MKKTLLTTALLFLISGLSYGQLIISGIYDGDVSVPKGIEIYVITTGDYTGWEIKYQTNAATTWSTGYTMGDDAGDSGSYTAGDYIYITSTESTLSGWGWGIGGGSEKGLLILDSSFNQNGDDRIAVFNDSDVLIDIYGEDGQDGTGEAWEYTDSYAYRKDNVGASTSFNAANWTIAGANALESADPDQQTVLTNVFGNFSYVASSDPAITSSSYSVSGLSYLEDNGPSSEESITVSGSNLEADISIAGTTNFEISTATGGSFSATNPITLSETAGEVAGTSIYIRLKSGLTEATYNDTLVITSTNADTVRIALEGIVSGPLSFPYTNAFGDSDDLDGAVNLGFTIDYTAQTSYLRLANGEYIETPTIDFTEIDGLYVSYSLTTFGGSTGQEFSTLVSDDNGATYDTLATFSVTGSYTTYTTKIDLTGDYNVATGKIKMVMTGGTNSTRLQSLSIKESYVATITGTTGWRLLSTPTSDNSYDDLLGDIWTQGIATGADVTTGDASVKSFNGSFVTVDDLTATMTAGAGFAVYVYSDDDYDNSVADAGFPKTLSVSGTANTGSISPTLNTTASAFSLVGNPYTSTIDWDDLTKTDLMGSVYVYDTSVSNYIVWNGTAGGLTDGLLAPFQGFFVQTNSGTGTELTIEEADQTTGGTFYKETPTPVLSFKIDSETQRSQAYFSFTPEGKMGEDNMDAAKLSPLDFVNYISVASESEGRLLDINNLPRELENEIEIPISINAMKVEGTTWVEREEAMTISWPIFDNIPTDWEIEFVDYQEQVRLDVRTEESYQFTSNSGATQEKKGSMFEAITPQKQKANSGNRFALVVRPSVTSSNEPKELPSVFALEQNYPNPFNPATTIKYSVAKAGEVQLSVYNMMGQKVADLVSGTKSAGSYAISWNAENMASGMYFYRLSAAGQTMTRQMTLIK